MPSTVISIIVIKKTSLHYVINVYVITSRRRLQEQKAENSLFGAYFNVSWGCKPHFLAVIGKGFSRLAQSVKKTISNERALVTRRLS